MATIYAEATLAIQTRQADSDGSYRGGPVYYRVGHVGLGVGVGGGTHAGLVGEQAPLGALADGDGPLAECGAAAASTTLGKANLAQTAFGVVFGESAGAMFVAVCLFFFAFSSRRR